MAKGHDRRLTPARTDLAAETLRGHVTADRFVTPEPRIVIAERSGLWPSRDRSGPFDTELLYGEPFDCLEFAEGWAWGQSRLDGYVGYLPADALGAVAAPPSHAVATLGAQIYPAPKLKQPPIGHLPFGARVAVDEEDASAEGYSRIGRDRWVATRHLRPLSRPAPDWVEIARLFLGVPYLWGGRSSAGIDCSGLVQLARQAAGHDCPRDSDMQAAGLGTDLPVDAEPVRGDLIFWRGHVGIVSGPGTLLHANAYHMAVAEEPLAVAIARIGEREFGQVTRRSRLGAALVED